MVARDLYRDRVRELIHKEPLAGGLIVAIREQARMFFGDSAEFWDVTEGRKSFPLMVPGLAWSLDVSESDVTTLLAYLETAGYLEFDPKGGGRKSSFVSRVRLISNAHPRFFTETTE